jgi:hypothetical protein
MAYVPNYEWDVFISYARDDNQNSVSRNWISKFYKSLAAAIQKGVKEDLKVFFDERSLKSYNTIESILTEVQRSAVFVIIGSSNWLRSDYCQKELRSFLDHRADDKRVFVAEYEPPEGEFSYPSSLPNTLRIEFWKKGVKYDMPVQLMPAEREFQERLAKISSEIRERIIAIKKSNETVADAHDGTVAGKYTVFLAYSTQDVAAQRDELQAYLEGMNVDVLPKGEMPASPARLQSVLADGLARSTLFVQMLGEKMAWKLGEAEKSPTLLQAEAAQQCGHLEIFIWRDNADPKTADEEYRPLLTRARNGTPNELGQAILRKLKEQRRRAERQPRNPDLLNVLIEHEPSDGARAQELLEACREKDCVVYRDDSESNALTRTLWADASAVAFVQGNASSDWLMARHAVFSKARKRSEETADLKGEVVVFAPPSQNNARGRIGSRRLEEIDLSEQWNVAPFTLWVDRLCDDEDDADDDEPTD